MVEITVCGWPRSGNCWVARLLGEALGVKVVGIKGGRDSIAAEGFERTSPGYVKQAHLWPNGGKHLRVDVERNNGHIFLLVVRNPRDVAVSMSHYWEKTIDEALDQMIEGPGPIDLPHWRTYVESWLKHYVPILRYEDFYYDTEDSLRQVLEFLGLEPQKDLAEVVAHQSFAVKKAEMKRRGNRYPFGKVAQLKHLRSGKTGEWEDVFSDEQKDRTRIAWNGLLGRLGYA